MEKKTTFKKLIKDELKSKGLKNLSDKIVSIRYSSFSMGNAIDIETLDMFKSERDQLESIVSKYQYGSFDGMTDCYNMDNRDDSIRQVKYVHTQHYFSEEIKQAVNQELIKQGIIDDKTAQEKRGYWLNQVQHMELYKLESRPEKKAA